MTEAVPIPSTAAPAWPAASVAQADVSVALCTRNGARYLPAQVASICTQDLLPREIVLSDDDSSDDSVAVVERTLAEHGLATRIPLTVMRNRPPLGVTRNFEQAIRACRGELIALCDQDDVWHAGRLRRMVAEFERRPELLLLHSDARLVDGELKPLGQTLLQALETRPGELADIAAGRAFAALMHRNLVTGATTMLRRTLLDTALPISPLWVHDEWLATVGAAIGRIDLLAEPLMDYRQHGNNQIGAQRMTLRQKIDKALGERGDKYVHRVRRSEALLAFLQGLGPRVAGETLALAQGKLDHFRFRAGLPHWRPARVLPVALQAARGRYARFDRGLPAILQDLLERG